MPKSDSLPKSEEVLASYLKGVDPCESAAEIARLEGQLVGQRAAAASLRGYDGAAAVEQAIKDTEAALARLRKKATSQESLRLALVNAKDRFMADQSHKRDVAAKGAASAAERLAVRHKQLDALNAQLERFAAAMVKVEAEYAAAHSKRNLQREQLATEVLALFESRIAEATPPDPVLPPATVAPTTAPAASATGAAAPAGSDASSPAVVLDELAEAKRRAAELEGQLQAFREQAKRSEAYHAIVADLPEVASMPLPSTADATLMGRAGLLHQLLAQWTEGGAQLIFTLADVATTCTCAVEDAGALAVAVLGDTAATLFPNGFHADTVVSRQAAQLIAALLNRMAEQFQANAAAKTKAASSYAELVAKRARVE